MMNLYTFLHHREKKRGERVTSLIRIGLLLPLLFQLFIKNRPVTIVILLLAGTLTAYALTLFFIQRYRYQPLLSTLTIIIDSLILSGVLFYRSLSEPGTLSSSPLIFIYPMIIYFAFLRSDEIILLLTVILNIILYNSAFLVSQGFNPDFQGVFSAEIMGAQLLRTMILVIFGMALFDQSRRIRAILKNQNDYFEKVRTKNKSLFKNLEKIGEKYNLSKRENEVLRELIKGKTYRSIGEDLFVSLDTIKSHVKSIYRKTGLKSRNELFQKLNDDSSEDSSPFSKSEG